MPSNWRRRRRVSTDVLAFALWLLIAAAAVLAALIYRRLEGSLP